MDFQRYFLAITQVTQQQQSNKKASDEDEAEGEFALGSVFVSIADQLGFKSRHMIARVSVRISKHWWN